MHQTWMLLSDWPMRLCQNTWWDAQLIWTVALPLNMPWASVKSKFFCHLLSLTINSFQISRNWWQFSDNCILLPHRHVYSTENCHGCVESHLETAALVHAKVHRCGLGPECQTFLGAVELSKLLQICWWQAYCDSKTTPFWHILQGLQAHFLH